MTAQALTVTQFMQAYLTADLKTRRKVEKVLSDFTRVDTDYKAGRISKEENDRQIQQIIEQAQDQ